MQRRSESSVEPATAPPIVHAVLRSPGQPLDATTRAFMEPRFGRDFSEVRVLVGSAAAKSAQAINARAYTVGGNLVFGAGEYAPRTSEGQRLLAHELAHVVQQTGGTTPPNGLLGLGEPDSVAEREADAASNAVIEDGDGVQKVFQGASSGVVYRACLSAEACRGPIAGSSGPFSAAEANKPQRQTRQSLCSQSPPDPGCTANGHGARAVQTEEVVRRYNPVLLTFVSGMFVDKDLETEFGLANTLCQDFTPPIQAIGYCTHVSDQLERNAEQFNTTTGPLQISGRERGEWRTFALMSLQHEIEHARFNRITLPQPGATACKFEDVAHDLSELAAQLSEFDVLYRYLQVTVSKSSEEREAMLNDFLKFRITSKGESISGVLKAVRCQCDCPAADEYIKKTVEFATATWTWAEKDRFHRELLDPKWSALNLSWPVAPPSPPTP